MAIERISKFVTSDGKEHTTYGSAVTHEKRQEYTGAIAKILTDQRIVPGQPAQLASQLILNDDLVVKLRDTLTKVIDWKRHLKKK